MAARIEVQQVSAGEFRVRVIEARDESSYSVTLRPQDYQRLAGGQAEAEELVRRSFEFLLEREPKESILPRFDLPVIARYFPEYEREITRRLTAVSPNKDTKMKKAGLVSIAVLFVLAAACGAAAQAERSQAPAPSWTASLEDVRRVAAMIPGRRPLRIDFLKFAESRRTKNFSVQGAPVEPSVQARTVFQVVYADGYVMVDAGMDEQVHKFFGRGVAEPFDAEAARRVEQAVRGARSVVVTHEHGDHVAGVIRTAFVDEIAPKTLLTRTQLQTLLTNPQMPEIKLTPAAAARYNVVDYEKYLPYAPGMALIKAPGHTPGSQMIYLVLESGREYVLAGDAAWHMDGVRLRKGKDAPWVTEDKNAVTAQLNWLHELDRTEKNLAVVVSHDDELHKQLVQRGLLHSGLE